MRAAMTISLFCFAATVLSSGAMAQDTIANLDDLLRPTQEEFKLPALVAAVAKDGEIVAAGAVGERAFGSGVDGTVEDRIHIGSDGKAMTATIAGMLVDSGDLRWDSTIGEVLGDKVPGTESKACCRDARPASFALKWHSHRHAGDDRYLLQCQCVRPQPDRRCG